MVLVTFFIKNITLLKYCWRTNIENGGIGKRACATTRTIVINYLWKTFNLQSTFTFKEEEKQNTKACNLVGGCSTAVTLINKQAKNTTQYCLIMVISWYVDEIARIVYIFLLETFKNQNFSFAWLYS